MAGDGDGYVPDSDRDQLVGIETPRRLGNLGGTNCVLADGYTHLKPPSDSLVPSFLGVKWIVDFNNSGVVPCDAVFPAMTILYRV